MFQTCLLQDLNLSQTWLTLNYPDYIYISNKTFVGMNSCPENTRQAFSLMSLMRHVSTMIKYSMNPGEIDAAKRKDYKTQEN